MSHCWTENINMSNTQDIDLGALQASAAHACSLMKVMANADRLMLLCQISRGEKSVGELEELAGVRQPTLSQQLTVLREEGLVSTRRDGKKIYYSIASQAALAVMQVLYQEFCGNVEQPT